MHPGGNVRPALVRNKAIAIGGVLLAAEKSKK